MTVNVIENTVVNSGDLTTYGAKVAVEADGNYYFGIHAVSDADNMMLAVDNISVDDAAASGIHTQKMTTAANETIYSLNGSAFSAGKALPKGIYVKNGKKFIVQ